MNDHHIASCARELDERLLQRLSRLRRVDLAADIDGGLEARLLRELRPAAPRRAPARFLRERLGGLWEPLLLSLLSVLLAWDLARIIGCLYR